MTIVAVLQLIGAILILIGSLGTLFFRDAIIGQLSEVPTIPQDGTFVTSFAIFLLISGLLSLLLAYGLFKLKGWAWIATLILQGLGIVSNLSTIASGAENQSAAVLQIAVSVGVIYYLLRAEVRRAFGR
ncbi:MAG TPA: hypothetical protein V6C57_17900 [Coleofasciculaceae cyanobacterium]